MNAIIPPGNFSTTSDSSTRSWQAQLNLSFASRSGKTILADARHKGPLRVQRPFYPEQDGSCHVYLLHPPGGIVIGDELSIATNHAQNTQTLLTTPSAGRIYSAKGASQHQIQSVELNLNNHCCVEWLPQETIVYDGANANLHTRINVSDSAKFFAWDILRLGRRASGESFTQGSCRQTLEVWHHQSPIFIEKNNLIAGSRLLCSSWGLQNASILGTLISNIVIPKDQIDALVASLDDLTATYDLNRPKQWGLTQKRKLFIARYLGDSISLCRKGFNLLWQTLRPSLNHKHAMIPRIWNT